MGMQFHHYPIQLPTRLSKVLHFQYISYFVFLTYITFCSDPTIILRFDNSRYVYLLKDIVLFFYRAPAVTKEATLFLHILLQVYYIIIYCHLQTQILLYRVVNQHSIFKSIIISTRSHIGKDIVNIITHATSAKALYLIMLNECQIALFSC